MLDSLLGPEDKSVLTGRFAEYMLECDHHGLEPGVDGWVDDDLAFAEPWGFAVEDISRPVLLLHGEDDRFVPVSHGHWLAARIPGVEARIDAVGWALDVVRTPDARGQHLAAVAQLNVAVNTGLRKAILAAADSSRVQRLVRRHGMRFGAAGSSPARPSTTASSCCASSTTRDCTRIPRCSAKGCSSPRRRRLSSRRTAR